MNDRCPAYVWDVASQSYVPHRPCPKCPPPPPGEEVVELERRLARAI